MTFELDANGILNVKAVDKATNKEQSIEITGSSGLSDAEVEQMKKDAEAHAEEDKKKREVVDLKNQADAIVFQTRKQIDEYGDKVDSDVRGKIESALSNLEDKIKGDDADAIKAALENLNNVRQELGAAMNAAAQEAAGAGEQAEGSADGDASDDDVIDAEYEVKN